MAEGKVHGMTDTEFLRLARRELSRRLDSEGGDFSRISFRFARDEFGNHVLKARLERNGDLDPKEARVMADRDKRSLKKMYLGLIRHINGVESLRELELLLETGGYC